LFDGLEGWGTIFGLMDERALLQVLHGRLLDGSPPLGLVTSSSFSGSIVEISLGAVNDGVSTAGISHLSAVDEHELDSWISSKVSFGLNSLEIIAPNW